MSKLLITGTAGFIGFHMALRCLELNYEVIGVDNVNDYYDVQLKEDRLKVLQRYPGFRFQRVDLQNASLVTKLFQSHTFDRVVHLAAQAGVRYSLSNPHAYTQSNVEGTLTILEGCRHQQVSHLIYASSSSVYGLNTEQPFSTSHETNHPISLYAATKKANEMMAHCYSHLYQIPTTGLRFFTVYGPWGRPDMALFKFTEAIMHGKQLEVYNQGRMKRDFTYVDDIVSAMVKLLDHIPSPNSAWDSKHPDPATSSAPYRIFNIGNNQPTELARFIEVLESVIGKKADIRYLPLQPGDVLETYADVDSLSDAVGFAPSTSIEDGIAKFVDWYRTYYDIRV
ncbi:MAG: NAD-dependent epimerase [Planctomycetes bacterium]|nr:NAD-dependent epimerase [Planctomycetota bacterium]